MAVEDTPSPAQAQAGSIARHRHRLEAQAQAGSIPGGVGRKARPWWCVVTCHDMEFDS